jgi:hypothetical protein
LFFFYYKIKESQEEKRAVLRSSLLRLAERPFLSCRAQAEASLASFGTASFTSFGTAHRDVSPRRAFLFVPPRHAFLFVVPKRVSAEGPFATLGVTESGSERKKLGSGRHFSLCHKENFSQKETLFTLARASFSDLGQN